MGIIGATAISGIEVALWDILGKELGVPVWRLLGGKTRDRVPVYTHLGMGDMRAVYDTMQLIEPDVATARPTASDAKTSNSRPIARWCAL